MITEDYVSFEIAKLLKEKRFAETTLGYYLDDKDKLYFDRFSDDWNSKHVGYISAPTPQMAMKWLREVHKIGVFPSTYAFMVGENGSEKHVYGTAIINLDTYELMTPDMMPMPTYEQALEAAIKYCLENLI